LGRKKSKDINTFDKSNMKYYYGISSYDTTYSVGNLSHMEAYEYAYKIGLNFMFITDHNSFLSEEVYLKESKYSTADFKIFGFTIYSKEN